MRKLVFGIIAVVLLQVAFYSYVAISTPNEEIADTRRPGPVGKVPELAPVAAPQRSEPTQPEQPEVALKIDRAKTSAKPAISRQTKLPTVARNVPSQGSKTGDYVSSSEQFVERRIARAKVSPAIPRGYTMVLVDYTQGGIPVAYSKPRARTLKNRTPVSSVKLDSEARVAEVAKPERKRPYLARALPSLVKKPWKWMKSLASKLN